jgi:hypothetical protein
MKNQLFENGTDRVLVTLEAAPFGPKGAKVHAVAVSLANLGLFGLAVKFRSEDGSTFRCGGRPVAGTIRSHRGSDFGGRTVVEVSPADWKIPATVEIGGRVFRPCFGPRVAA